MTKRMLLLIALTAIVIFPTLIGCQKKRERPKEIVIQRIMPPQSSFHALRRMTRGAIKWVDIICTDKLVANDDYSGFQMGVIFANWTVASLIQDEDKIESLTTNWVELTQDFEIEDDAVLLRAKEKIDNLKSYVDAGDRASYNLLTTEIKAIYNDFKDYYEKEGDEQFIYQATLAIWAEFLYIGINGVLSLDEFDRDVTILFNRAQEIEYFRELLKTKKGFRKEVKFLTYLRPQLTLVTDERLTKEQLTHVRDLIKEFREDRIY